MRVLSIALLLSAAFAAPAPLEPRANKETLSNSNYHPDIKWEMNDELFGKGSYWGIRDGWVKGSRPLGVFPEVKGSYNVWKRGSMPQFVYNEAKKKNWDVNKFLCYGISTSDCPDKKWSVCIHDDAETKIDYYFHTFLRLPLRLRNYVRHAMTVPGGASAYTYSDGNIVYTGEICGTMMLHEIGHSIDYNRGLSKSQGFTEAVQGDGKVLTSYANENPGENFAELTMAATYDANVKGGLKGLVKTDAITNQLNFMRNNIGDLVGNANPKCDRYSNDKTVYV